MTSLLGARNDLRATSAVLTGKDEQSNPYTFSKTLEFRA